MDFTGREKAVHREHESFTASGGEGVSIFKPEGIDDAGLVELSTRVRPSWRQLRFVERSLTGFIHFSVNTFTGNEWGDGSESPDVFWPDLLDTDEWVRTFRKAGISCITLVAKHHDGFCLWPSKYTDHCVRSSSWRNGEGDIVADFVESCRRHGTSVGIYYSPWDRHEKSYGTAAYNDYMIGQLEELLTGYGPVEIVWFDGAGQDPNTSGTYMAFDWPRIYHHIKECQPGALIDGGIDTRWVGNEAGRGRKIQWSVQSVDVADIMEMSSFVHGLDLKADDLGSIAHLKRGRILHWLPARGGTPTRAGWFWHPNTDHTVRSLDYIVNAYFSTVGQNSPLQLNIAPDRRGLIADGEKELFRKFGEYLTELYSRDFAEGASVRTSEAGIERHGIEKLLDTCPYTCWAAPSECTRAEIVVTLPGKRVFNVVKLQENIRDFGQRVSRFAVDVRTAEDEWGEVYSGETIGYRVLLRIPTVETDAMRIRILDSRVSASLAAVGLFYAPPVMVPPSVERDRYGTVSIESKLDEATVRYTLDGSVPSEHSPEYTGGFPLPDGGSVTARAFPTSIRRYFGTDFDSIMSARFGIAKSEWRTVGVDRSDLRKSGSPAAAIDADEMTSWDTRVLMPDSPPPYEIVLDLGREYWITGFSYLPDQREYKGMVIPSGTGLVRNYSFHVSSDGKSWGEALCKGEFHNIQNSPLRQTVELVSPRKGRYVRFTAERMVDDARYALIAEIGVNASLHREMSD